MKLRQCVVGWALLGWACQGADPGKEPETDVVPTESDSELVPETDPPVDTELPVDTDLPENLSVVASGPIVCLDPARAQADRWTLRRSPAEPPVAEDGFDLIGGGVVVADLTGDGLLDVFMPGIGVQFLHVQQPDGTFDEEAATRLAGLELSLATAASLVDVDADGDLDLFVTRWQLPNKLLINDGAGQFTDGTAATGITGAARAQTSAWGDMDRDGDLDLFVGNYGPRPEDAFVDPSELEIADPSQLWENLGDGTFADRSERLPQQLQDGYTFMSSWVDLDDDGWTELLVVNDFGWSRPSTLFWNRPTGLEPDDGSAGFSASFAGMGLGIADLNGDGVLDFVQSSWRESSVLVSNNGAWFEASSLYGVVPNWEGAPNQVFGWGTEVFDLENDGDDDILINYGFWSDYGAGRSQVDAVYVRAPDGSYVDRASTWEMDDHGVSRGLAVGDLNGDGRLDVVKRQLGAGAPMFLSNCNENGWLRIKLRAPGPNRYAVGATVRVRVGEQSWVRPLGVGTSMYSAAEPEVHFGLGLVDVVDEIEIRWPGGELSTLRQIGTRQTLEITRR